MKKTLLALFIGLILTLPSCKTEDAEFKNIRGFIQGSTYSIVYEDIKKITTDSLKKNIEDILHGFDKSLSMYYASSIICKINRNEDVKVDAYIEEVYKNSVMISELSGGAFDITIGPLAKAWGFGADAQRSFTEQKRDSLLNLVGMEKVKLADGKIIKSDPNITLDFSAIAQGYSVDVVARYLNELGIKNYLIEIGGEVRARGTKNGNHWRIGIDRPEERNITAGSSPFQAIVRISDKSLATSGNYRKFYVEDGVKYSHTIDPKTGYPARNRLLSVTVLADECGIADGIATVCMVLGHEQAQEFLELHPEYSAFMVYSGLDGEFETWMSESLKEYLTESNQ